MCETPPPQPEARRLSTVKLHQNSTSKPGLAPQKSQKNRGASRRLKSRRLSTVELPRNLRSRRLSTVKLCIPPPSEKNQLWHISEF